eukprot:TRINITY_DN36956_c0_g1_i1.p1 TRINITY_DN36956_c0_g1~~TRINITY_DN36956_c0_g1_i1.p1  ORF type:complete len:498 (-),score=128.51 TRINITY_DN36956_c0_g1_i1:36-1529(-)
MSFDERILDLSKRLAAEYAQTKARVAEDRERFDIELEGERTCLIEELSQRQRRLEAEKLRIGREQARLRVVAAEVDEDVLELNVGGQLFSTRRSTLCLFEGSYLANLFSGRWESSIERDAEGRFFLDFDPGSFRLLLNFLRNKQLEGPGAPMAPPIVPPEKEEHFSSLVEYLGLGEGLQEAAEAAEKLPVVPDPTGSAPSSGALGASLLQSAGALLGGLVRGKSSSSTAATAARPAVGYLGSSAAAAPATNKDRRIIVTSSPSPPPRPSLAAPPAATKPEATGDAAAERFGHVAAVSVPISASSPAQSPSTSAGVAPPKKVPGWSKKYSHHLASTSPEDPTTVEIADTRSTAAAAAVRATRGFNAGTHAWTVHVDTCSDWSYVGFVSEAWCSFSSPLGRAAHSWGVASNGTAYAGRAEVGQVKEYKEGSYVQFIVDLEAREAMVVIDGQEFPGLFQGLASPIFPAVSNCRSPARYSIEFVDGPPEHGHSAAAATSTS